MSKQFFELIPHNASIDFIGKRWVYLWISIITFTLAALALAVKGLNYGVDFQGGTQLDVHFQGNPTAGAIREALAKIGQEDSMVQESGGAGSGKFLIRVPSAEADYSKYQIQLGSVLPGAKLRFSEDRLYVRYEKPSDPKLISEAIDKLKVDELRVATVSQFGRASDNEYMVMFAGMAARIIKVFEETFGKGKFEVLQIDQVGPKVGKELRTQAVGAVLISMILILIYVGFRFEFDFAPGAVLGLLHDTIIILGIFAYFQFPFDLSIVAAVLTIVGFSVNDTIVVYDRIRENLQKTRSPDLGQVMNDAINQTLSRTILTSGTVLLASLSLVFFGGPITYHFSLAFTIGVIVGTYSSISVSSALTLILHNYKLRKKAA